MPRECRTFRRGFVFKDGKGYLFEPQRLTVMRPWPAPAAWRLTSCAAGFGHVLPDLRIAEFRAWAQRGRAEWAVTVEEGVDEPMPDEVHERLLAGFAARTLASRAFLSAIPPEVLRVVARFEPRQWHVLSMLGRAPGSLELARSNPALAWALASNTAFHRPSVAQPMRACRTWANRPRPRIAGWLGFPPTRSAARLLAKVDPSAVDRVGLLALRKRMHERAPNVDVAAHLPRIGRAALEIVGSPHYAALVRPSLLCELGHIPRRADSNALRVLHDTSRMLRRLGLSAAPVGSLAALGRLHDEAVHVFNRTPGMLGAGQFPVPPIPGDDAIEPLTDTLALLEESRALHHCVASYAEWVAAGHGYVYRVLAPERATFTIEPTYDGGWILTQLRGHGNAEVSEATRARVERWLAGEPEPVEPPNPTPFFPEFGLDPDGPARFPSAVPA